MKRHANSRSEHRDLELAAQWALRRAEGESLEDDTAFRAWRDQDPGNSQVLAALEKNLEEVDRFAGAPDMLRLRRDALAAAQRSHALRRVRSMFTSRFGLVAGVAFICVVLGVIAAYLRPDAHTLQTAVGERRSFLLPDGSALSLDAATELTVDYSKARRRLSLQRGRAKFDVARDPLRPFFVEASGKVVVATGTSFSVELVESQVRVVLYEGHVEVLPAAGAEDHGQRSKSVQARLLPGQELVAPAADVTGGMQTAPIDTARSLAWQSGDLTFEDDPLALAVERVNRYSDKPVTLGDSAAAAVRISGIFHAGDTQAFIEGVTAVFPVRAVESAGKTTLLFEAKSRR